MASLINTVFVTDPENNQTVVLAAGTCPEPRLAALVTNPSAWVDGKLPRLPKATAQTPPDGTVDPTGGPDGASGDGSDTSGDGDPEAKKTAAKKAATSRSRGRNAAGEGASGE